MSTLKERTFKYWIKIYCYNNAFIRPIKHNIKNEFVGNTILLLASPYILLNYWFTLWYEKHFGFKKVERLMNNDRNKSFMHELAVVSISKNEGPYIVEWIEFHRMVGVSKFYFYDNESQDDTEQILKPYVEKGIVDYIKIPGVGRQLDAYNDAIKNISMSVVGWRSLIWMNILCLQNLSGHYIKLLMMWCILLEVEQLE